MSSKRYREFKRKLKDPLYTMTKEEFINTVNWGMPDELIEYIMGWENIKKSPYNNTSYYNGHKDWSSFIDKGIRISDHWNFNTGDNKTHCITNQPVENNKYWYVGIYDASTSTYNIVKQYPIIKRKRVESPYLTKLTREYKMNYKPSEAEIEKARQFKHKIKAGRVYILWEGREVRLTHLGYHFGKRFVKIDGQDGKIFIPNTQEFIES